MRFFFWPVISATMPSTCGSLTAALAVGRDQATQVHQPSPTQTGSPAGKRREVQQYENHPQDD
jgi:hypothetical protein